MSIYVKCSILCTPDIDASLLTCPSLFIIASIFCLGSLSACLNMWRGPTLAKQRQLCTIHTVRMSVCLLNKYYKGCCSQLFWYLIRKIWYYKQNDERILTILGLESYIVRPSVRYDCKLALWRPIAPRSTVLYFWLKFLIHVVNQWFCRQKIWHLFMHILKDYFSNTFGFIFSYFGSLKLKR